MGVVYLDSDEPGYLAATRTARNTCWQVISEFRDHNRLGRLFIIKARLYLAEHEKMLTWLLLRDVIPEGYIGEMFEPEFNSERYPLGSKVYVKAEDLIDWAIVDARIMEGGFTVRYVYERASPTSRIMIMEAFQITGFTPLPQ